MEPRPAWDNDGFLEALLGLEHACQLAQTLLARPAHEPPDRTPDGWLDFLLGLDVATLATLKLLQSAPEPAQPPGPAQDPPRQLLR